MLTPLWDSTRGLMPLGITMSGSGKNTERILGFFIEHFDAGDARYLPRAIFTNNPFSRAAEIHERFLPEFRHRGYDLELLTLRSKTFFQERGVPPNDEDESIEYDTQMAQMLRNEGVEVLALAGYMRTVREPIIEGFRSYNVHPANTLIKDTRGKTLYWGDAWVPSAKAILNGEAQVNSVVHLVVPDVDQGPVLSLSTPQAVPETVLGKSPEELLQGYATIDDYVTAVKLSAGSFEEKMAIFPLYAAAHDCQMRLKEHGDLVIFAPTLQDIGRGRYALDEKGAMHYDGSPGFKDHGGQR
jgi:folate-dependent phosphoribosylglycinamide formyltransferase PurN